MPLADSGIYNRQVKLRPLKMCFEFINDSDFGAVNFFLQNTLDALVDHKLIKSRGALYRTEDENVSNIILIITVLCNNLEHLHLTR